MNQDELLTQLLQRLDEPAARYAELDRYYQGKQPLAFLSPEAKLALGNRFGVMASNIPRLAVTALAERLRITGFTGDTELWSDWVRNDLDQTSGVAHREALLLGDSFVIVWADRFGRPARDRGVGETGCGADRSRYPPGRTPRIKRWEDTSAKTTEAVMYQPDRITRLRADQQGAVANGFRVVDEFSQSARRRPGRESPQH